MTGPWWRSSTWSVAHMLTDESETNIRFGGAHYRRTRCGVLVRAERITPDDGRARPPLASCVRCKAADAKGAS